MKKLLSTQIGAGFCGFLLFVLWIVIFTQIFNLQSEDFRVFPHYALIIVSITLLYRYLRGTLRKKE